MSKKRFPMSLELATFICEGSIDGTLSNDDFRHQVLLGRFPQAILTALNIPNLEVVTSVSILAKLVKKHQLGPGVISGLHELICSPLAVYKSATQGDSIVVVTMMLIDGDPLIAAIVVNAPDAYMKPNMHWLTSAYPKDNHEKLAEWETDGLLLWRP